MSDARGYFLVYATLFAPHSVQICRFSPGPRLLLVRRFLKIGFFFISDHRNSVALWVEFDHVHVRVHKEQAPASGLKKVFAEPRVIDGLRLKARTLVCYGNFDLIGIYGVFDFNFF